MKTVLILNPYLPTLGGGEKHMGYLCKFIEEYYNNDVRIDILVHDYNDIKVFNDDYMTIDDLNKQFGLNLTCTFIRKYKLIPVRNFLDRRTNLIRIGRIGKDYDICINFKFKSFEYGHSKTNIYECMFPQRRLADGKSWKVRWYAIARDFLWFRSYDSFVNNSEYTQKWFYKYWKKSPKARVIYPPVFSRSEIASRYDESKKQNIIISTGRFFVGGHCKRQIEMVKFFINNQDVFADYEYHLVGAIANKPEDQRYLDKVKRLASQVDNVFIHENAPFDELIDLYQRAKIFWHGTGFMSDDERQPQNMEHFGITTVEAMSYGVVPVVIRKGGQTETVKEGINGYLWDSEAECVSNTKKLIDNDELRQQMAQESALRANDYSIETFFEKNKELFNDLHL